MGPKDQVVGNICNKLVDMHAVNTFQVDVSSSVSSSVVSDNAYSVNNFTDNLNRCTISKKVVNSVLNGRTV